MNLEQSPARAFDEDLPWLAFLYVSEELTPDEVVDFEERLLTDQSVREAVAEAMKMADGLWVATAMDAQVLSENREPAGTARSSLVRWAVWFAGTVAAAGLAFYVGWWFAEWEKSANVPPRVAEQPRPEAPAVESSVPLDAETLVGLWSNSYSMLAELGPDSELESLLEEPGYREQPELEEDAFGWMLAVVGAPSPETPETHPDVMEN